MAEESALQYKNSNVLYKFWNEHKTLVWIVAIMFLALALRIYDLGTKSYWVDEIFTILEGKQTIYQILSSGRLDQPPAYYLPFHLWMQIFGAAEASTRAFSLLAGISSVVLIFLIGRELFGETVGLLSSFLLAISGFQIIYSQETRFYSFFEFTVLLSFFFMILALKTHKKIYIILYVVVSILMLYSHTIGVFILIAQNLYFLLQIIRYKKEIITWIICQSMILLLFVPYFFPLIYGKGNVNGAVDIQLGSAYTPPTLLGILRSFYLFIIPSRLDLSWKIIFTDYALAGILLGIGVWIYVKRQGKSSHPDEIRKLIRPLHDSDMAVKLIMLFCWLLIPPVMSLIISKAIIPIYADRYMICVTPALYLLLAVGIFNIRKIISINISVGIIVILSIPGLVRYYQTNINDQWREAAAYVVENARPDDMIVFAPEGIEGIYAKSFNWYYRGGLQRCSLSDDLVNSEAITSELMNCLPGHNRFWVIMHNTLNQYRAFFLDPNQTTMQLIKYDPLVNISVYLFDVKK